MILMKFGGTSIGSAERIRNAIELVKARKDDKPVLVVSAFSKVTDSLISAAYNAVHAKADFNSIEQRHKQILNELGIDDNILKPVFSELKDELNHITGFARLTPQLLDLVVSYGERLSARIVSFYANTQGLATVAVDSFEAGMLTDARFGRAEILPETFSELKKTILPLVEAGKIPVLTGFIGKTKGGHVTTLGRGGSDYSASIIGAAIGASEIQIWTDVNGVMSADPKIVPNAITVARVSFDEASELAYFGAKVLHPKTLLPAMYNKIPVRVLNTFEPKSPGTEIVASSSGGQNVKAIAVKKNISLITIKSTRMLLAYGFLHRIFKLFEDFEVSVDMIATSEVSVSLTIDKGRDIEGLIKQLMLFSEVKVEPNVASISLVGDSIMEDMNVPKKIFETLEEFKIGTEMISQGASDINIGIVVNNEAAEKAVVALHRAFFEEGAK